MATQYEVHVAEHEIAINPECRSKKHRNCDFKALCVDCDAVIGCECTCHADQEDW